MKVGPPRQRGDACIAGGKACVFWRQRVIGGAGADDDPVSVIAGFCWELEQPSKDRASLQFDGVAATRAVDRLLQIVASLDRMNAAGGGSVSQRTLDPNAGQLRGAVEAIRGWSAGGSAERQRG